MVVFFDIDGTLVDEATQVIPESAVCAVKKLEKNGHLAVVNTGRPFCHIDPRVQEIPFSAWICGCGMEIWFRGQRIHHVRLRSELCGYVRDSVRECGMQVMYETERGMLLADGIHSRHPMALEESRRMAEKGVPTLEIDALPQLEFMKFMSYDCPGCNRTEFTRRMAPYFDAVDRGFGRLEFMKKGCSKSTGISVLMQYLGASWEDTLAIGDSTNDLSMFRMVRHSACMGDGMDELKAASELITDTVLGNGVEKALRHFGLI